MSRIDALNQRYSSTRSLIRYGVELIAVADSTGARFSRAVSRLIAVFRQDGPGLWDDLAGAARLLRWNLITQPQPVSFNRRLMELVDKVQDQADHLRSAVADLALLEELVSAASDLSASARESEVGTEILNMCTEVGAHACVVVVASRSAQRGLEPWLDEHNIAVITEQEYLSQRHVYEQAYVVGYPRIYGPHIFTAPTTDDVSYVFPSWILDRDLPIATFASYAEGAIKIRTRLHTVGIPSASQRAEAFGPTEDEILLPQPAWQQPDSGQNRPQSDEVRARKILLSGNQAIWLDDGERIRTLDPSQPAGERVIYTDVRDVRTGTYLVLRKGETESGALHDMALAELGARAKSVEMSQHAWKDALARTLVSQGNDHTVDRLKAAGIDAAERARAWVDPLLVRPSRDKDFQTLLSWLGIPIHPALDNANMLRRARHKASAHIRRDLESALSTTDLGRLAIYGRIELDDSTGQVGSIFATRVLAVSPYFTIVPRSSTRLPFYDRAGQWLDS